MRRVGSLRNAPSIPLLVQTAFANHGAAASGGTVHGWFSTIATERRMTPTHLAAQIQAQPDRRRSAGPAAPASVRLHTPARRAPKKPRSAAPVVAAVFAVLLLGLNLFGLQYYLLPKAEQVRSPLHVWLRPSGYIGQGAGVVALAIFLFLWLYPLRKKFRWLAFTGALSKWLDVHSLAALGLPLLVAAHATWKFGGVIGIGFWSMMVVWASGIVGRYLYARIPRSQAGVELTIEEIGAQRQALLEEIAQRSGLDATAIESVLDADPTPTAGLGPWQTVRRMVADDLRRRRAAAELRRRIQRTRPMNRRDDAAMLTEVLRLANREMALVQQSRMLEATQNVLRFWHVAHRPLAVTALAAVLIHVAVVVSLGATWFW